MHGQQVCRMHGGATGRSRQAAVDQLYREQLEEGMRAAGREHEAQCWAEHEREAELRAQGRSAAAEAAVEAFLAASQQRSQPDPDGAA